MKNKISILLSVFLIFGLISCSALSTTQPENVTEQLIVVDRQFTTVVKTSTQYLKGLEKPLSDSEKERVRDMKNLINKGNKILTSVWSIHAKYKNGDAEKDEIINKLKTLREVVNQLRNYHGDF